MEACEEAHAVDAGRFNGLCGHQYEHVVNGFSAQASTASASAPQDILDPAPRCFDLPAAWPFC